MLRKNYKRRFVVLPILITIVLVLILAKSKELFGPIHRPPISDRDMPEALKPNESRPDDKHSSSPLSKVTRRNYDHLEISRTNPVILQWSIEELESYLNQRSELLTSSEMKSLLLQLLPGPAGKKPEGNRLIPGSVSPADQARLCLKYLKPADQLPLLSAVWAEYRDSPTSDTFLGEVVSELNSSELRSQLINLQVSYYYGDYQKFTDFLNSGKSSDEIFSNFVSIPGDHEIIISGLRNASIRILEAGESSKDDLIYLISKSDLNQEDQIKIISHIEKVYR